MRDYFFFCHAVPTQPLFLQPHSSCAVCQQPLGGFFSACYECISMLRQFASHNTLMTSLHRLPCCHARRACEQGGDQSRTLPGFDFFFLWFLLKIQYAVPFHLHQRYGHNTLRISCVQHMPASSRLLSCSNLPFAIGC